MSKIKKDYKNACMAYIEAFAEKQGLTFDDWADYLEIADFGITDVFSLSDIRFDIDTNQSAGLINDWNESVLENHKENGYINYKSWCMGLRYKKEE